jgi:hypothetical protein
VRNGGEGRRSPSSRVLNPKERLPPALNRQELFEATAIYSLSRHVAAGRPQMAVVRSPSRQPTAPIIAALGKSLPPREITIDKLSLVIQHGPALSWNWRTVGTTHLSQHDKIDRCGFLRKHGLCPGRACSSSGLHLVSDRSGCFPPYKGGLPTGSANRES